MKEYRLTDWLPTTKKEVELRGWDELDVILFSGDAYVDHPSFGAAVIGRILEAEGLKVAIIPQPNWRDDLRDFRKLGRPRLFFGISAGSMDSMVNKYTANKRLRSEDAYTPDGRPDMRPEYPSIVYSQILKRLYPDVPVILGSIEASLRRLVTTALGAVGLCFPIIMIITAFSNLFGSGGAPIFSINRGKGDSRTADMIMNTAFTMLCGSAAVLMLIGFLFARPLLTLFGASDDALVYAYPYLMIYLLGTLPSMIATGMNPFINAQGYAIIGMLSVTVGAVTNIILDPIFIFVLDMGIKGAAIATVISQILSALLVFYFLHGKSELKVRWIHINEISECTRHARDIISLGSAGFIMQLTNSLVSICCNNVLSVTGGDIYISVMTIISSVRQMVETPIHAINEGTSPVLSYNYGARRPDRVKKAGVVLIIMVLIYTGIMWSVILIAPEFLIGIFSSDKLLLKDAVPALKLYFAAFIFMDLQYIGQTVFKSLNKKKQAIFFSLLRKVFIVVPLTYFLPYGLHMGTDGVFMAEPVSNVIGGSLCFITMLVTILPELNKMGNSR